MSNNNNLDINGLPLLPPLLLPPPPLVFPPLPTKTLQIMAPPAVSDPVQYAITMSSFKEAAQGDPLFRALVKSGFDVVVVEKGAHQPIEVTDSRGRSHHSAHITFRFEQSYSEVRSPTLHLNLAVRNRARDGTAFWKYDGCSWMFASVWVEDYNYDIEVVGG